MENKKQGTELDELIRSSMDMEDTPAFELNSSLKADLYRQEACMLHQPKTKAIALWYLPMILNFATFGLLAVMALLMIANPYLSKFTAAVCLYIGLAGIFITVLGVKRTRLKEDISIVVDRRGVIA